MPRSATDKKKHPEFFVCEQLHGFFKYFVERASGRLMWLVAGGGFWCRNPFGFAACAETFPTQQTSP
jgi:hypothetical protein